MLIPGAGAAPIRSASAAVAQPNLIVEEESDDGDQQGKVLANEQKMF